MSTKTTTKRASRARTLGLHEWTKEDTILTFYRARWGTRGLYFENDKAFANFIGVSVGSFKMQVANFRALMGESDQILTDYSKLQKEVFDTYKDTPRYELMKIVKKIIGQDVVERNQALISLGYNPKRMKLA